ncbi:MAG: hypothetical protein G5663_06280 [Serratia symbiotica]|nr:hypothetical protein [Serratia symbiotica]
MSKTRLFIPLMQVTVNLPHKLLYITFLASCIMGTSACIFRTRSTTPALSVP